MLLPVYPLREHGTSFTQLGDCIENNSFAPRSSEFLVSPGNEPLPDLTKIHIGSDFLCAKRLTRQSFLIQSKVAFQLFWLVKSGRLNKSTHIS